MEEIIPSKAIRDLTDHNSKSTAWWDYLKKIGNTDVVGRWDAEKDFIYTWPFYFLRKKKMKQIQQTLYI